MSEATGQEAALKALELADGELWRRALGEFAKGGGKENQPDAEMLTLGLVQETLRVAKDVKALYENDQTRFTFRNKQYVLADVFGRIVAGIDAFSGVIDEVAALDVSGQAALPWAAVKLVLGVSRIARIGRIFT